MVNIKMEFKHPKYYKELRKRNKLDQVISLRAHDGECERASWSGPQAASDKPNRNQFEFREPQASSDKRQVLSSKHQASSHKQQAH